MTPKDELAASLNIVVLFFLLSLCFEIRDYLVDTPFDKVTVSNDCSKKEVPDSFLFFLFFCIATPSMPLGITTGACLNNPNICSCQG